MSDWLEFEASRGHRHKRNLGGIFGDLLNDWNNVDDIFGELRSRFGGQAGGLSSGIFSPGRIARLVSHHHGGKHHHTAEPNAVAGNDVFSLGGQHNSLGDVGKSVLSNIVSGDYRRKAQPYTPPRDSGRQSFNLDFGQERQKCLEEQRLFEDPEFPADDSSLFYSRSSDRSIEWKRPGEIVQNPQLIVGAESRFDVDQGELGDCWLLAAVASLTLHDELFHRVVAPDQSFTDNYAGIFHFSFWRYGQWVDVVVDDRLPTVDGQLIYMHSKEHNEFWSALLEKAYAKLYGSYEALRGGTSVEAMEDCTGGLTETIDIKSADRSQLLATLVMGFQSGALFGCSIDPDPYSSQARLSNGLVRGHAYSITGVENVNLSDGSKEVLIRCRNPWGDDIEWNGAWSNSSSDWDRVPADERPDSGHLSDGEFWMAFDDWRQEFEQLEMCTLSAGVMADIEEMTGLEKGALRKAVAWSESSLNGEWSNAADTAGGCRNDVQSMVRNPQHAARFSVPASAVESDGNCDIIVALMQKFRRELKSQGLEMLPIGFEVYRAPDGDQQQRLDVEFLEQNDAVAKTHTYINLREVCVHFRAPAGDYVLIPCTFEPGQEAEYLLRVFANGHVETQDLTY